MRTLNRVRVEWAAAAFGLLTGVTMVYVPYEFGTSLFNLIYPDIRLLGSAFLAGSATMIASFLYPSWPAWIGWLGRVLFLGALTLYWWAVTVLSGGMTGMLLYPLMIVGVIAESLPRWRARGLFREFLIGVALAFGGLMLLEPTRLGPIFYPPLQPIVWLVGLLFLVAGGLLFTGLLRPHRGLGRAAMSLLALLFACLAFITASRGSWTGLSLYGVLSIGCVSSLFLHRLPMPSGIGWRLFRGVALASVLPILAVGGLASVLAQKAIERELRDKAQQAVAAEVAWLEQTAFMARFVLLTQTRDPSLRTVLRSRNPVALWERLELLKTQPGPFDAAWVLDSTGDVLMPLSRLGQVQGNFAHRDYFEQARRDGQVYLSRPFLAATQRPMVVFSLPVDLGDGRTGILAGGVSLLRLGRQPTLASRSYHVEIFDQRDGKLLRETERGDVLTRAPVLAIAGEQALSTPEGLLEAFDSKGRRLLVAHAQVPGTPWTVSVTAPLREAFAAVTRLSALVVGIALTAGAIALLMSRWVGREVAERVTALRDGFAALGTLRLEQPVPTRGDDELAQLTAGFNEMAARIDRAQKELHEAIASRDQFLSMASHELRTPLTPLKATIELLLRQSSSGQGLAPERQRPTLERLRRQVDRLTRLIGDMLDVTRLQSGRLALRRAPMDLSVLAREVIDRIQHARSERTTPIQLELPEEPLSGHWDEQRLDQLLTNLVENAVRYSPPDAPIHVRARMEGEGVLLEVEDQGIGIPADSLPNLFTPFYRAGNASQHYAGGMGLGLAICREIVERHGGTILATSEGPGRGTRFSVRIPRNPAPGET